MALPTTSTLCGGRAALRCPLLTQADFAETIFGSFLGIDKKTAGVLTDLPRCCHLLVEL
jgi:hypothetical protein